MEKKSITIVEVQGTFSGHQANGIMEWECPFTGQLLSMQGEFAYDYDLDHYYHDVYNEQNIYQYTVIF